MTEKEYKQLLNLKHKLSKTIEDMMLESRYYQLGMLRSKDGFRQRKGTSLELLRQLRVIVEELT